MSAPINIPKKSDEYHRQRLITQHKLWQGKMIMKSKEKETKTITISLHTFSEKKIS